MNSQDKKQFREAYAVMSKRSGVAVDTGRGDSYFSALVEYPLRDVLKGMLKATNNNSISNTLPTLHAIIEALEGDPDQAAMNAYAKLQKAHRHSSANYVTFDDPCLDVTIEYFGGIADALSAMFGSDAHWSRKEFMSTYKMNRKSGRQPQRTYHNLLPGANILESQRLGYESNVDVVVISEVVSRAKFKLKPDDSLPSIIAKLSGRPMIEHDDTFKLLGGKSF